MELLNSNIQSIFNDFLFTAEYSTLYHRDLRQDVFLKDEFHYLNVSRVGAYTVYGVFDCTFKCLSNPSCLSLNLAASKGADGKLWCELLSSTKHRKPEEFGGNGSSHHFSIQVGICLLSKVMKKTLGHAALQPTQNGTHFSFLFK